MTWLILVSALLAIVLAAVAIAIYLMKRWGLFVPAYVQAVQAVQANSASTKMLTDGKRKFAAHVYSQINALRTNAEQKQAIYRFVMDSDEKLSSLMSGEGVPVALAGVEFGALTIIFRLRLREYSRSSLDKLMKLDKLVAQALCVEGVRLVQSTGYIDCEVMSPVRIPVDLNAMRQATSRDIFAIGMDAMRHIVTVDTTQHGLIAAIAPSRRGKTEAVRTMISLAKLVNPDIEIVVLPYKRDKWLPIEHAVTAIYDYSEMASFCQWLLGEQRDRAVTGRRDKLLVVIDDLLNLIDYVPNFVETIRKVSSAGAGLGINLIVTTQYTNQDTGGTALTANATCRLMFKPASVSQGSRDSGMAGLGLDQLSSQKGDAVLVVDGEPTRITTALTPDSMLASLPSARMGREWLQPQRTGSLPTTFAVHPMEEMIEKLNGWLTDDGVFDWEEGRFNNRSEAMRRLDLSRNGRNMPKLHELERYIARQFSDS